MKVTIIGGGNMGGAIVRGLVSGTIFKPGDITVIDILEAPLKALQEFNSEIKVVLSDYESVGQADMVIIAVKPWLVKDTLLDIKFMLDYSRQIIVSAAARISIEEMNDILLKINLEQTLPVLFRVVPNTAISVKKSITLIASKNATDEQESLVLNIFNELGTAIVLDESKISAGTALTSCGIAFLFRYVKAAMSAGVELGFPAKDAQELIVKTMLGAATLLDENKEYPEIEIDKVTTPGGITIQGINELEAHGFSNAIIKGYKKCKS